MASSTPTRARPNQRRNGRQDLPFGLQQGEIRGSLLFDEPRHSLPQCIRSRFDADLGAKTSGKFLLLLEKGLALLAFAQMVHRAGCFDSDESFLWGWEQGVARLRAIHGFPPPRDDLH